MRFKNDQLKKTHCFYLRFLNNETRQLRLSKMIALTNKMVFCKEGYVYDFVAIISSLVSIVPFSL